MDGFLEPAKEKRGINKVFIVGTIVGALLIGAAIWLLTLQPSMEDQVASILEGSFREGSPEFEQITKDFGISR